MKCGAFAEIMDQMTNFCGNAEETENSWRYIFEDSGTRQKEIDSYVFF